MWFKTFIISIGFAVVGCVPHHLGDTADLAEPTPDKSNVKQATASSQKTDEELATVAELAGKWSVVREGKTPCALQLKTAQFGRNYLAGSVCSGKPNVWAWNTRQDALLLFDNKSELIASFHESENGKWRNGQEGGEPALHLVPLGN